MESDSSNPINSVIPQIEHRRLPDEDFWEGYANNVLMEPNVWDLKLIFGQLDQRQGPNVVVQHTAITLPWNQVKVLLYLLKLNVDIYEMLNGKISFPKGIIRPPVPPTDDQLAEMPRATEVFEYAKKSFEKLLSETPELE
ncbi:MAG: DUF3467 domain-containing protein [Terriglobia bacterium]